MLLTGDLGSGKTNTILNSSKSFIKFIKSHHSDIHCTKMKFSIKGCFRKCDLIRSFLRIWSHLLKKFLMGIFIVCAVIDKFHFYAKHSFEAKCKLLISKRNSVGLKYCNDSKAFMEYSEGMNDIYENIEK